jgi:hypothetical protein
MLKHSGLGLKPGTSLAPVAGKYRAFLFPSKQPFYGVKLL